MHLFKKIVFLLLLFTAACHCYGQTPEYSRYHTRIISIEDSTWYNNRLLLTLENDSTFTMRLWSRICKSALYVYPADDTNFTQPMTIEQASDLASDVIICRFPMIDPINGVSIGGEPRPEYTKFYTNYTFRILEQWTRNTQTGKTEIKIKAIGPVFSVYDTDNKFVRYSTLFWAKYTDLQSIVTEYDMYNPEFGFSISLWRNYFSQQV